MLVEWLIFLSTLTFMLEASVKTIDRFRELVRHIIEKQVSEGDIQKLELLALSLLTTIVFGLNLLDIAAISVIPTLSTGTFGAILTGLLIGRGANVFHGIVEKIQEVLKLGKTDAQ
jgi:hypothetical protein